MARRNLKADYHDPDAPFRAGSGRTGRADWSLSYCIDKVKKHQSKRAFAHRHAALAEHIEAMGWEHIYAVHLQPTTDPEVKSKEQRDRYMMRILTKGPQTKQEFAWLETQRTSKSDFWVQYQRRIAQQKERERREEEYVRFRREMHVIVETLPLYREIDPAPVFRRMEALRIFPREASLGSTYLELNTARLRWAKTIPTLGEAKKVLHYEPEFQIWTREDTADRELRPTTFLLDSDDKTFMLWRAKSWLLYSNPFGYVPQNVRQQQTMAQHMPHFVEKLNETTEQIRRRATKRHPDDDLAFDEYVHGESAVGDGEDATLLRGQHEGAPILDSGLQHGSQPGADATADRVGEQEP